MSSILGQRLLAAAGAGNMVEVQRLYRARANLNYRTSAGVTPLHAAAYEGYLEICMFLLERSADKSARTNFGETPVDSARNNQMDEVAHFIESWMQPLPDPLGTTIPYRPAGYIDGTEGIMLVNTSELSLLLAWEPMTSYDINTHFWMPCGNIFSIIPEANNDGVPNFKWVTWEELPSTDYAVLSYQWGQDWHSILRHILQGPDPIRAEWIWIDSICLDQTDMRRMETIRRSDEIYSNANEYHLIEMGALTRGWVLFELASVNVNVPPIIHNSNLVCPTARGLIRESVRRGFEDSGFSFEDDRDVVRENIVERHGSVSIFNEGIIAIVNQILGPRR